ncbi:hypothetical protein [Gordonia insulae]|uniref:MmpS family membrane protein n=1 Tax=Gordonia insulae TaxID=2420509 RepID=A0A3G8JNX4_9ACTN|nr:hypothetical protein [Gordonia insulae]AZG46355.1 hypothetical protein D7316_02956 [Gordonia insulae]
MTQPPDDRWDPNRESPETRRFEPSDETSAYGPADETAAYGPADATAAYRPQDDPYGSPQAYTEAGYQQPGAGYGPGYGPAAGAGAPPPPPQKHTGRTVGLALAVLVALVVIVLVVVLIARGSGSDDGGTTAGASSSSAVRTESSRTTSTTTTTTEDTTTTTTPTVAPGAVVYQLTGNGDVIGIRFVSGNSSTVVAAAGAPWSQATTVGGSSAEITAIVIRGPVTCTILHGDKLLASSTSNGGPLRCAATVPSS